MGSVLIFFVFMLSFWAIRNAVDAMSIYKEPLQIRQGLIGGCVVGVISSVVGMVINAYGWLELPRVALAVLDGMLAIYLIGTEINKYRGVAAW
jgi:hypothetical protein